MADGDVEVVLLALSYGSGEGYGEPFAAADDERDEAICECGDIFHWLYYGIDGLVRSVVVRGDIVKDQDVGGIYVGGIVLGIDGEVELGILMVEA